MQQVGMVKKIGRTEQVARFSRTSHSFRTWSSAVDSNTLSDVGLKHTDVTVFSCPDSTSLCCSTSPARRPNFTHSYSMCPTLLPNTLVFRLLCHSNDAGELSTHYIAPFCPVLYGRVPRSYGSRLHR